LYPITVNRFDLRLNNILYLFYTLQWPQGNCLIPFYRPQLTDGIARNFVFFLSVAPEPLILSDLSCITRYIGAVIDFLVTIVRLERTHAKRARARKNRHRTSRSNS
jgi:hypothetical protein